MNVFLSRSFKGARQLLFGILIWFAGSEAFADVSLIFGTYTPDKPTAMVDQLRPTINVIEKDLETELGQPVQIRLQVFRNYTDGVNALVTNRVDVMRVGPASYVHAKGQEPGIDILAVENNDGSKFFNGVIIVKRDGPIQQIADLRGKTFAFGDEHSTLGRFFAQLHMIEAGIGASDLAAFEYLGRHDRVGMAVSSGQFDAGALEETTFQKLLREGAQIRAIVKFPNITRPWVASKNLDPSIKTALRKVMLEANAPEAFRALRFGGFLPGTDRDYEATREAIRANPRFFVGTAARLQ